MHLVALSKNKEKDHSSQVGACSMMFAKNSHNEKKDSCQSHRALGREWPTLALHLPIK